MKRLFTLAIIAMIASLSFAQTPAQVKKAAPKAKVEKVMKTADMQKAMEMKAAKQAKAQAADVQSTSVFRHAAKSSAIAGQKFGASELKSNIATSVKNRTVTAPMAKTTPRTGTPTVDAHGIITAAPANGEARVYTRSADAFYAYVSSQQQKYGYQSGNVDVVIDGDDWYIKDIICNIGVGTWVKGQLNEDGSKLVIPAGQMIYWSAQGGYGMTVNMGATPGTWAKSMDDITYTVNDNTLTLDGAHASVSGGYINFEDNVLGAFWTDDDTFAGYGEWSTVLTYDPGYVPPTTELVQLPDGAQTEEWHMNATSVSQNGNTPITKQAVNVAFVGNDVYVQGIFKTMFPNAWIKGTIDGTTATFENIQYIGKDSYGDDTWAQGYNTTARELCDFTATYDADAKTLTGVVNLLANCDVTRPYYDYNYADILIYGGELEEPTITTLTAELPYANSFDTEAEQAQAAIYDANSDGKTFTFAAPGAGDNTTTSARYTYSSTNDGDDYVVFPGLTLAAGTSYKVSVDARSYGGSYPERFEVVCGTEAKASTLTTSVIAPTEVASATYATFSADFTPEADGVYYFAIHGISDADMFYLYTDNFSVKENNMNAPKAVTDVTVTPDEKAALKADIKFTAPSQTLAETAIDGDVQVKISRNGEVVETVPVGAGSEFTYTDDKMEKVGTYTWSLVAIVNELESDAVTASAYVGEDLPEDVENLTAVDLNDKVGLSWDAPTTGYNDGIIIPENLTYNVYPVEMIEFFGMQFPSIDFEAPYATGVKETSYEVEYPTNEGEQDYTYFGVTVENVAGETNGSMAAVLTGAPYELPFVEQFPGGKLSHWWGADYDDAIYDADGGLAIGTNADGTYNFTFDAKAAGWIELMSGKISLNGADAPALTFNHKALAECGLQVQIITPEGEEPDPSMLTVSTEEQTATIDLSIYADQPWIRFNLIGSFDEPNMLAVSNVIVMNMVQNDLQIAVSAPKSVTTGNAATVKATVKNVGQATAENYDVKFYVNGTEAPTPMFEILPLAFMDTAEFEFELETSIFDEVGDVTVKAEVVFDDDENDADNADEVVVELVAPSATPVESVTAENTAEGVLVSWTVAENTTKEVTEDFESYEVGITADGETMGSWTAKDGDQEETYGWTAASINWDYTGEPYAFAIMNFPTVFGSATDVEAPSGEQALMFMSTTNGNAADDWFISPELPGVAQTISFQARPMTANYGPEELEVMASEDGQTWTKVANYSLDEEAFVECTANLAEGTKYFALHYVSNDIFALFVDDLKYTVGGGDPTGFNVYVDQNLVATVGAEETSYTYSEELSAENHDFSVTAVYGNNESAPVTATLGVTTAIKNIADAQNVEVYTVDGIRMNGVKNLKAGVYVVNGQKVVIK